MVHVNVKQFKNKNILINAELTKIYGPVIHKPSLNIV